jgi:hypothetical protein
MIFEGGEGAVNANLARVTIARVVTTEEVTMRGRLRAGSCLRKLLSVVDIAICEREREDMGGVSGEERCWKWMSLILYRRWRSEAKKRRQIT